MSEGEKTVAKTETKFPWSNYTLKLGRGEPVSTTQYVLYAVQIAAIIILSYLSVAVIPLSYAGISIFYFVYPFFLVFTMWWGAWGMLGAYVGCVVGAGVLVGTGPVPSILYSISDLIPPLIAFVIYRGFLANRGIDPLWRDLTDKEVAGVKTKRVQAWVWFILLNGVVLNLISGVIGVGVLYELGDCDQMPSVHVYRMGRRRLCSDGHHYSSAGQRTHKSRRKARTSKSRLDNLRTFLL